MSINNPTIQVERTKSYALNRIPARRTIALGAAAMVVAIVTLGAVAQSSGHESVRPMRQPAPQSRDEIVRDLVNRGLVPSQTLQAAPQSRDDIVRDLVNRGLVPSQTLQTAPQSRDDIVRDLVERGLVPAATLDDVSQI